MTPNTASSSAPNDTIAGLEYYELAKAIASTNADVFWLEDPRFRTLEAFLKNKSLDQMSPAGGSGGGRNNIVQVVEIAKTPEEATSAVTAHLVQGFSRLLMLDAAAFELAETKPIASYWLESMIGMESRN
ncbi:hypothetical protein MMC14_005229 [Varicellaria rhodocarpa]|nr:hypothetical protein [Varicellaria rhodocarpa]